MLNQLKTSHIKRMHVNNVCKNVPSTCVSGFPKLGWPGFLTLCWLQMYHLLYKVQIAIFKTHLTRSPYMVMDSYTIDSVSS